MTAAAVQGDYLFVGMEVLLEAIFQPGTFDGPFDSNFRATHTAAMLGEVELQAADFEFVSPMFPGTITMSLSREGIQQ